MIVSIVPYRPTSVRRYIEHRRALWLFPFSLTHTFAHSALHRLIEPIAVGRDLHQLNQLYIKM
jgi:hypothetical protein